MAKPSTSETIVPNQAEGLPRAHPGERFGAVANQTAKDGDVCHRGTWSPPALSGQDHAPARS
jgi:hypothetical protein